MQNFDNIYPKKIDVLTFQASLYPAFKKAFRRYFPVTVKTSIFGFMLLILQVLIVGLFDRFGVSPKLSFLISSVFYIFGLGCLALIGSIKVAELSNEVSVGKLNQPICKMLIIRKKGEQKI